MERACTGTEERLLKETNIQSFLDFIKRLYPVEVDLAVVGSSMERGDSFRVFTGNHTGFHGGCTMIQIELLVVGEQDDFMDEVTLVFRNSRLINVGLSPTYRSRGIRLDIPNEIYKKELIFNI
jgi:hypothetical protein